MYGYCIFILHWFYFALTGYVFVIYVTDQNIAFLVPDSCWATERNGNSISADVTDGAFENVQNDAYFSYIQTIYQLFWTFDIAGETQYTYSVAKYKTRCETG